MDNISQRRCLNDQNLHKTGVDFKGRMISWKVESQDKLLPCLKKRNPNFSLSDIRWCVEHNRCWVNGLVERFCSIELKGKDEICFWPIKKPFSTFEKGRVLYEDEEILAYHKPPFLDTEKLGALLNLFPIHRLDRDTTGILLFAKKQNHLKPFQDLFRSREVEKEYLTLVSGNVEKNEGVITLSLNKTHPRQGNAFSTIAKDKKKSLSAKTLWKCLKREKKGSLLLCRPITGRTHQIRAHLKSMGHPVLGDYDYGSKKGEESLFRPLLHASSLKIVHPYTKERLTLIAPLPVDFHEFLIAWGLAL